MAVNKNGIVVLGAVFVDIKGFRGSGMRRVDDDHARQLQFVAKMQE